MTDIRVQLRAMPSSLNDACRTMEAAADQIDALLNVLEAASEYLESDAGIFRPAYRLRAEIDTAIRNARVGRIVP